MISQGKYVKTYPGHCISYITVPTYFTSFPNELFSSYDFHQTPTVTWRTVTTVTWTVRTFLTASTGSMLDLWRTRWGRGVLLASFRFENKKTELAMPNYTGNICNILPLLGRKWKSAIINFGRRLVVDTVDLNKKSSWGNFVTSQIKSVLFLLQYVHFQVPN